MLLQVTHETHYQYTPAVDTADHVLHLRPPSNARQTVQQHHLSISPEPPHVRDSLDTYGNHCSFFSLQGSHEQLSVTARTTVDTHAPPPAAPVCHVPWEQVRDMFRYRAGAPYNRAWEFLFASPYVPRDGTFADFARVSFAPGVPLLDAAHHLMARIYQAMAYDGDSTDVNTPALTALEQGKGVCQDFAHIMVACCRAMGLPARYVSGYMLTQPAPGQPRLVGCDASHAWASVYCPNSLNASNINSSNINASNINSNNINANNINANNINPDTLDASTPGQWVDFDPTNNRAPGDDYVMLATGRDFLDVSPLRGVIRGGAQHALRVAVTVMPLQSRVDAA